MTQRNILLNPGPATTTASVKQSQVVPDICPREREFGDLMARVCDKLVRVVEGGGDYVAVPFGGSGTLGLEACISSVVPPDRALLVVDNGAYGTRMARIAEIHGIEVVRHKKGWGEYPDLGEIEALLAAGQGHISHLAVVHHETTTGMLNPAAQCVALAHNYGAETIVDAMSSYAGLPITAQDMGFDYLVSSSNKCIQGMAGVTFVICRKASLARAAAVPPRTMYMDLNAQSGHLAKTHQSAFTPPVQVFYALEQALDEFFAETPAGRYSRYARSYQTLYKGLARLGFRFLLPDEHQSSILLAIEEPTHPGYDFDRLHDHMRERGFTIYPGKGALLPTFRLSVLGAIDETDIKAFLAELGAYLRDFVGDAGTGLYP